MNDTPLSEFLKLQPKWNIPFTGLHGSLARPMNQPLIDDDDGLVIFGNSAALYLARIVDPGQEPYSKLKTIPAATLIHGCVLDAGKLYVIDGVEIALWNLGDGVKTHSLQLVEDKDVATARAALLDLKQAIQSVEWATLLEQAEDEWIRLTTQQVATSQPSDERDRLDALAADYFGMLRAMRKMVGTTGGGAAARQKIVELRKTMADKRKAAAPSTSLSSRSGSSCRKTATDWKSGRSSSESLAMSSLKLSVGAAMDDLYAMPFDLFRELIQDLRIFGRDV